MDKYVAYLCGFYVISSVFLWLEFVCWPIESLWHSNHTGYLVSGVKYLQHWLEIKCWNVVHKYQRLVSVTGMHKVNKRKTQENVIIKNLGTFPSSFQTKYWQNRNRYYSRFPASSEIVRIKALQNRSYSLHFFIYKYIMWFWWFQC